MKWLNRSLIESPYCFALCRNAHDFDRELKRLNVPKDEWPRFMKNSSANATTYFFEKRGKIERCAIVCLGSTKGKKLSQIHALLCHEAVHIWQAIREDIGEDKPSDEFEAYAVQSIAQSLMEAL